MNPVYDRPQFRRLTTGTPVGITYLTATEPPFMPVWYLSAGVSGNPASQYYSREDSLNRRLIPVGYWTTEDRVLSLVPAR